ncbi:MAG: TIGR04255 family protein [Pseudonocardiaceae bacterium]
MNEVVIAVSFEPQPVLEGPRLMTSLNKILAKFPKVDELVPYDMPLEQPFEEQVFRPPAPPIQFISTPNLQRRYWFTKEGPNAPLLLQIQSNYFAVNWRHQEGELYPGFDRLNAEFDECFTSFQEVVDILGGPPLRAAQVELTYINILQPDKLWGGIQDLHKVVNVTVPEMNSFEQFNLAYSQPVKTESGAFFGRLHTVVSSGFQPKAELEEFRPVRMADLVPVINILITARSGKIAEGVPLRERFERAHDAVTKSFKSLTTEEARKNWGLL